MKGATKTTMTMMLLLLFFAPCQAKYSSTSNAGSLESKGRRIRRERLIDVPSEMKPERERLNEVALDMGVDVFRMLQDDMSMSMSMSMETTFESFFEVGYFTVNDTIPSSASFQEAATALATVYNGLGSNRTMEAVRVASFEAPERRRRRLQNTQRRPIRAVLQASGRCLGCPPRSRFTTSSRTTGRRLQEVSSEGIPTTDELFAAYREFIAQGNVDGFEDVPEFEEPLVTIEPTVFPEETAPPTLAV